MARGARLNRAVALLLGLLVLAWPAAEILAQSPASPPSSPAQTAPAQPPAAQAPVAAAAPPAEAPSAVPAAPPAVVAEVRALRTRLDTQKAELDRIEATLQRGNLSGSDLQNLRAQVEPIGQDIRTAMGDLAPRLEDARARLEQLGPKPKAGEPEESAQAARERAEREAASTELGETQRLAGALLVQAEQLVAQISDRRRTDFARATFKRNQSIVSPDLWASVMRAVPRELYVLQTVATDWASLIGRRATLGVLAAVGIAVGIAMALYIGRRSLAPRLVTRNPNADTPTRRRRLLAALGVLLVATVPATAGSFLIYQVLDVFELFPTRFGPFMGAILGGLAVVAFVHALADAMLAPGRTPWRLIGVSDAGAVRITGFAVAIATVITIGKVVETLNQGIAAALPITVATRGLFAILVALLLAELLRRSASRVDEDEACLGPAVTQEVDFGGGPLRFMGWAVVGTILASALLGYVAFASFLVDQLVWIVTLAALLYLALALADSFIGGTLRGPSRVSTAIQANTGLRRRSVEQIGILATGLARVALVAIAIMLALAPWGVESADLTSSLGAAFFGFQVGGVTISLSAIVIAIVIFAAGFAITRLFQRWLDSSFLPATDLDAGLRNSIVTVFGYVGIILAGAIAFSYLGLSLDRIAILAGALSVGIGFGLQSIVNNFVSGLILLWERPIRVGDLVVVGDGEGHVRKISVRATEIETFDRSTVIVPNSNLISGVVRNRVRGDRTGRVIVPVNVLRNQDPVRAAELITACAGDHPKVLKEPPPRVLFRKIGDTWLEFELIAFVSDVNHQASTQSDLNFSIFRRLSEEGFIPPLGPGALSVLGLEPVQGALDHIAEAIGGAKRREQDADEPAPKRAGTRSRS